MSRINRGEVPTRLQAVQRRFDEWRRTHRTRSRLPESLWASAVKIADTYGIHRTAKALRLDYYSLKRRVEPKAAAGAGEGDAAATFLELPSLGRVGAGECTLELEDSEGAKMRIHLKGYEGPDLTALARGFWGGIPS
jgi:hypothetical protein